jgi:hypothetical protein
MVKTYHVLIEFVNSAKIESDVMGRAWQRRKYKSFVRNPPGKRQFGGLREDRY